MRRKARELLTPAAFGQAVGVSRQAVSKAIASGRLSKSVTRDERTGRARVDLELGRREWLDESDPSARRRGERKKGGRPPEAERTTPSLFEPDSPAVVEQRLTHARASAERISWDAKLKQMQYEAQVGTLVPRDEVRRAAFELGRTLRDRMQAIPDALPDLTEQQRERLAEEIASALTLLDADTIPERQRT